MWWPGGWQGTTASRVKVGSRWRWLRDSSSKKSLLLLLLLLLLQLKLQQRGGGAPGRQRASRRRQQHAAVEAGSSAVATLAACLLLHGDQRPAGCAAGATWLGAAACCWQLAAAGCWQQQGIVLAPCGDPIHETDRKILKSAQQGYQNPLRP
eukprot:COSAG01_NODE_6201_length_3797_cov_8.167388_5_plen_152_part_00